MSDEAWHEWHEISLLSDTKLNVGEVELDKPQNKTHKEWRMSREKNLKYFKKNYCQSRYVPN